MIHDALHDTGRAPDDLDCERAREHLSARLDGELADSGPFLAHLARCPSCRAHERALGGFALGFAALRESASLPDLWPRIEHRAHPRPDRQGQIVPVLARLAAALAGFVGLGGAALLVERADGAPDPRRHLLERLAASAPGPDALFATLPEYRLLRALPARDESR
jgi:hypothetical protein